MDFDPENPFQYANKSDQRTTGMYFLSQRYYKLRRDYMAIPNMVNLRRTASEIVKQYAATGARDPVIPYLAMAYFDFFVSVKGVPSLQGIAMEHINKIPLFLTCCFIIAWKMRKPQFCLPDFLIKYNLPYLIGQVEKLELLIDRWLQRPHSNSIPISHHNLKRPVTSFCFLDYLIELVKKLSKDETICLKNFATHKLYALQYDIRYTLFKPSLVAAAAIAFCVNKYYEYAIADVLDAFLTCEIYNNEKLKLAIEMTVPGLTVETGILSSDDDDEKIQMQTALSISLAESLKTVPPDRSSGEGASSTPLTLSSDGSDDDEKQLQAALSLSLAESLKIVPPDRSPGEGTSTAQLTLLSDDDDDEKQLQAALSISLAESSLKIVPPDRSADEGSSTAQLKLSSDDGDDDAKQLQAALSLSLAESLNIVPPDRSPGEGTSTAQLTLLSDDDDDEKQLQAALSISLAESSLKIVPPDRSPNEGTSTAQLTLSAPDRSPGALADTTRMMMPPVDRSPGAYANKTRPESSGAQEKSDQQQISSLSSSLAAALCQSVVNSRFPRSAPGHSPGARTSSSLLTLSAPDRNREQRADTRRMMLPPANSSQGARAHTRRMVMLPFNISQGARANNRIDIEMLPPPNRIPTRLGLTPSELPPRKRGITVDQISREAKGKGKLYPE